MAAASVCRQTPTNLAFEDYSVYGHLSDEELIQLAIERSLTDGSSSSQPTHQSESAARTQVDGHCQNVPPHANPPQSVNPSR